MAEEPSRDAVALFATAAAAGSPPVLTVRSAVCGLAGAALIVAAVPAVADDESSDSRPDATPYRPTVTTPAALSAPHWLEGELGAQSVRDRSNDDGSPRRASIPYTLKYAFSADWGVRIGGEALVRTAGDGQRETGFGDTGFVVKRRFAIDDASALGLEVGALYPTARADLHVGSGKPDYSANAIYSADVAGWHSDVNVIGTRLGAANDDVARWQTTAAVALSHPLAERWQVAAEWAGTRQHGAPGTAQLLGALSWAARHDVVFDFGGIRGLNRATPTWQAFAGVTVVVGRID